MQKILGANTVGEALDILTKEFAVKGIETPKLDARVLIAHILHVDPYKVMMHPEEPISDAVLQRIADFGMRRLNNEPVSRIVGVRDFWNFSLDIGKDTLDPRSDTETIVEAALSKLCHKDTRTRSILDIGTGSGCIILALLKEIPEAVGLGIDIIPGAVLIAEHNAAKLGLRDRVKFQSVDLNNFIPEEKFDLVVSNPPYVALREFEELAPEVRKYDPKIALVAGEDGLELYRQVANKMQDFLMSTGAIFLEIGKGQAEDVNNIFFEKGFELVQIYKDLAGIDRVLEFKFKSIS